MNVRLLSIFLIGLCVTQAAFADLVIERFEPTFNLQLGNFQIAGFRAEARNTGTGLKAVRGRLATTEEAGKLRLLSRHLWFGRVDAFASRRSYNSLIVVAPRSKVLDDETLSAAIDVDFRFRFDVTLNAQVIDEPIPNAIVTAAVGGATTQVIADADGNFSVDLSLAFFDDFVTLDAFGGPGQEFVALRSLAGTALELHNATGIVGGASVLTANQVQSLDITHVTTAKAVLAEAANGGPVTSGEELAAAEIGIDTLVLLRFATAIKVIIDDATVALPAGFATTLALLQDFSAAEAFAADLQSTSPDAYNTALASTLAGAASGGFAASDVDGAVYSTILRNLSVIVGERLVFNPDGSAQRTDASGTFDATWTISPEGTLLLEPVGGQFVRPAEGFSQLCFPIVSGGVRTQTVYLGSEFNLVLRGSILDLVTEKSESFRQFPDNPECPPTDPVVSEPNLAFRWIDESGTLDYDAADFAGKEVIVNFWSNTDTRAPLGNAIRTTGQDFFTFNPDGTGTTRIAARDFLWTVGGNGHLEITMATGEFNEYVSLGTDIDGDVNSAINVGTTANGTFAFRSFQIDVDPTFALSAANVVGPIFVEGSAEQNTFSPTAAANARTYQFNADGSWFQNDALPFGDPNAAWVITSDERLEFTFTAFGFTRQDISWAPAAIVGDRYWVLEARQLGQLADPQFIDLGTATGSLTYYRVVP